MIKAIRGLVRPTVTWMMVGLFGYMVITRQIEVAGAMGIIGLVIGFWFNERTKKEGE